MSSAGLITGGRLVAEIEYHVPRTAAAGPAFVGVHQHPNPVLMRRIACRRSYQPDPFLIV
jgi:hypothetical protein